MNLFDYLRHDGIGNGLGQVKDILLNPPHLVPDNALRRKIWEEKYPTEMRCDFHWQWTWPDKGACRVVVASNKEG